MPVDVQVTADGQVQVTVDSVTYPPLPVAAVEAMAAHVAEAKEVAASRARTAELHMLAAVMAGPGATGSVAFTSDEVTAQVDADTFERAREAFRLPDAAGDLHTAHVVVRKDAPKPRSEES